MASGYLIGAGTLLFFMAIIAYSWQLDSGYTIPQVHEVCISDIGQMAQYWFGGDQDTRRACNTVQMYTYAIYGFGVLGIVIIIAGAAMSGGKKESEYARKVEDTEEEAGSLEILKKRYAKGEITKEEFENMKKDLK